MMAIYWGPYQAHMRVGIGVVQRPETVGQGTASVALDLEVWVQMDGSSSQYISNASITFTGDWFGTSTIPINLGPGQSARVWATTGDYPTIVGTGQNKSYGVTVNQYHGTTYHGLVWWIPPRPAAPPPKPSAPTGLAVSRSSDTRHTISWSRPSTYTSVVVQRRVNGGVWAQVGKPSGNASSWVDTTTKANSRYEYRVAGINAGGQSGWSSVSATVYTTQAAPAGVTATRSGVSITVAATGLPPYATHFDIEDNGVVVASAVARAALPWTHTNPSLEVAHTYRVRARVNSGGSNSSLLLGAWSAFSNIVHLTAPPNAPSNLTPNGVVALYSSQIPLRWQHNPSDASEQSAFQLRLRVMGTNAWIERPAVTSSSKWFWFYPWDLIGEPFRLEWQVRTRGSHSEWSPWSTTATADLIDLPQVSVTAPESAVDLPQVTVMWEWFQGQGRPQSAWQVEVVDANAQVVESRSGAGPASSLLLDTRLDDQSDYVVQVRAATGEVWSEWTQVQFHVAFVPPAPPEVTAVWNESSGSVSVSVGHADEAGMPTTVRVDLLRSIDGGISWESVLLGGNPDTILEDWESLSNGQTMYRAIAYADTGASAVTDVTVVADSDALWLSGGEGYVQTARLPYDPGVKVEAGRQRSVQRYEGRSLGVGYAGAHLTRVVDASGVLSQDDESNSSISNLEAIAQAEAPLHLYRDADGRRVYGVLSNVSLPRQTGASDGAIWRWSFQVDETDH